MAEPAKRLRIRRKDLRQPDEFRTRTTEVLEWVQHHLTPVLIGVGVVVVVGIAALAMVHERGEARNAAAAQFRAARQVLERGDAAAAAEAFATLAREAPGTPFGRLAALYRGHALARQGDAAGAATAYGEYLAGSPATSYLRQEALVGLAEAREQTGDAAGALEAFTTAAALPGPFAGLAGLAEARLLEAAGRAAEARAVYERLATSDPDADVRAMLEAKAPEVLAKSEDQANVR